MDMIEEIVEDRGAWHATMQGEWLNNNSLEGLMLKLKVQYFGHLMQRANWLEKTLMLEKTEGQEKKKKKGGRGWDSITTTMDMNLRKLQKIVKDRGVWLTAVHGVAKSRTWQWMNNNKFFLLLHGAWGVGGRQENKKQYTVVTISHIKIHEDQQWTYLRNRNRLTDVENRFVVAKGEDV